MRYSPPEDEETSPPRTKRARTTPEDAEAEEDTGVTPTIPTASKPQYIFSDDGAFSIIFKNSSLVGCKNLIYAANASASWRSMEAAWNNWFIFNSEVAKADIHEPSQHIVADFVNWLFTVKQVKTLIYRNISLFDLYHSEVKKQGIPSLSKLLYKNSSKRGEKSGICIQYP